MFARLSAFISRICAWLSPREVDQDFDQELEAHLGLLTEENVRRGMPPEEARRAARIRLGGQTQLKETNRELRGLPILETFFQDGALRCAHAAQNPGFTAVAVLTLALGIGANTAIFSVVYAMLLKPLPYSQPEQLFNVFQAQPQAGVGGTGWSYANFAELREQNHVFSEMAGSQNHQLTLTGRGEPAVVNTSVVTPEIFSLLGQTPLLGRAFLSEDGTRGAAPVVILSVAGTGGRADTQEGPKSLYERRDDEAILNPPWVSQLAAESHSPQVGRPPPLDRTSTPSSKALAGQPLAPDTQISRPYQRFTPPTLGVRHVRRVGAKRSKPDEAGTRGGSQ